MMRTQRTCVWLVLAALACSTAGCIAEKGARQGIEAGVKAAVSAVMQAPVDAILGVIFPE